MRNAQEMMRLIEEKAKPHLLDYYRGRHEYMKKILKRVEAEGKEDSIVSVHEKHLKKALENEDPVVCIEIMESFQKQMEKRRVNYINNLELSVEYRNELMNQQIIDTTEEAFEYAKNMVMAEIFKKDSDRSD